MSAETLEFAALSMEEAVAATVRSFGTIRAAKATTAILDGVRVEAYGSVVSLKQVANVSVPEPTLLMVRPYDPNTAPAIARAIQSADLGLNPSVDSGIVRVPVPPLTEQRRREYAKILHRMSEEGKVSVRRARQEARAELMRMQREGEIGEDESHRAMASVQELTDQYVKKIGDLLGKKEAEVMEI